MENDLEIDEIVDSPHLCKPLQEGTISYLGMVCSRPGCVENSGNEPGQLDTMRLGFQQVAHGFFGGWNMLKPSTSWFSGFLDASDVLLLRRWPRRSLLAAQYWKGARLLVIMIFVSKPRPISLSAWHRHKTLANSFCILFHSCFSEPQLHWVADFLCVFWCFLAPGVAHWQHLATLKDHLLLFDCSGPGTARPSDQHHWSRGLGKERRAVSLAQMALKKSYTTYMHRIPEFRPEWPFQLRKWWQSVGIQCFFLYFFLQTQIGHQLSCTMSILPGLALWSPCEAER